MILEALPKELKNAKEISKKWHVIYVNFLEQIPVPPGYVNPVYGPQGLKGDTGPQGLKGDTGSKGIPGVNGVDGTPGINGINGTNGANPVGRNDVKVCQSTSAGVVLTHSASCPSNYIAISGGLQPLNNFDFRLPTDYGPVFNASNIPSGWRITTNTSASMTVSVICVQASDQQANCPP